MKKLLNFVICLALLVSCLTMVTACDPEKDLSEKELGFTYELVTGATEEDSYLKVTGYNVSDKVAELVSQENYNDDLVKAVSKIEIPSEKVEYKRNGEVVGSYLVKEIAESAFANMLFIKEVVIPANVETVGSACLAGLSNLEKLTVNFVGNKQTGNVNSKKTLGYLFGSSEATGTSSITVQYNETGSFTCYVPTALKTVVVTGDVVSDYAFYGFVNVEEIVLSQGVTEIGASAFANCSSLYKINLGNAVTKIGNGAFSGCTSLTSIALDNVSHIGDNAFKGCSQLFYSVDGSKYVATQNVSYIGSSAFSGCVSLEEVDLSNLANGAVVKENAFASLTALESVKLSANSVSYANLVFTGATKLEKDNVVNYNASLKLFDFDYEA